MPRSREISALLTNVLSDAWYDRLLYLRRRRRWPNLRRPRYFNEKLLWLKKYQRDPLIAVCSDKYRVRQVISERVGAEYCVPLLGVYRSSAEIDPAALPQQFVLKASHGSGWNVICRDRSQLDWPQVRQDLDRWLRTDFSRSTREWCYANPQPRLVLEPLLIDDAGRPAHDFKVSCFDGVPKAITVDIDRFGDYHRSTFDAAWNDLRFTWRLPQPQQPPARPPQLDELLAVARKLAAGFPFCRVDCYLVNGRVYVGELTFYPYRGVNNLPWHIDRLFGDWLTLPPPSG
jgi:hypothetical protein